MFDEHLRMLNKLTDTKVLPSSGFFTNSTPRRSNLSHALYVSSTVMPICPEKQVRPTVLVPKGIKLEHITCMPQHKLHIV